jgi:hypothetical protein
LIILPGTCSSIYCVPGYLIWLGPFVEIWCEELRTRSDGHTKLLVSQNKDFWYFREWNAMLTTIKNQAPRSWDLIRHRDIMSDNQTTMKTDRWRLILCPLVSAPGLCPMSLPHVVAPCLCPMSLPHVFAPCLCLSLPLNSRVDLLM